ncbi:uncharacterized protein LOC124396127 [Silurus meridionalis]|uniref:C-type lectin domain-containing protein n=1 Tax=Silurus meridionalis TaxID=175797 RepID=A0A8T0B5K7_SILME|nr:uncharacterized protein LOC124396127 [Silurus meridionalis]KAF7699409.1 hypothetical protein HF521_004151 [Silurus meridionalis]
MKLLLVLLLLALACGEAVGWIREYTFINNITDWASAKTYCRNNHTGLANVTTSVENKRLIKSGSGSEGWLGLQVNITTLNDSDPTFFNWCPGCPSKYVKCVFTNTEGFWNTGFCMNKKGFYCYRFLILVKIKMTWEEAQDYCRAKYTGLASVISEASLQQVIEESAQTQTENVWTGLSFINGIWLWVSRELLGDQVSMPPQCPAPPYRCGSVNTTSNTLNIQNCNDKLNFVCFKK